VGVPNGEKYISMDQGQRRRYPELVDQYTVFGRVKPEQKSFLVSALQEKDHKVAMTGDGVNDIPWL
jgi:cation-transporting ATPase E